MTAGTAIPRGDAAVEAASRTLRALSNRAARRGGGAARLARSLADDATFVAKLKPSLIKAHAKGEVPSDETAAPAPSVRGRPPGRAAGHPFVLVAAALGIGVALAKLIDWRGHAHPRD